MFDPNMLSKLEEIKRLAEESKVRLEQMEIEGESGGGLVHVTLNGNRKVKSISIQADLKSMEREDLEDLLVVAFGRAIDNVNAINEQEVMSSSQHLFPGFG